MEVVRVTKAIRNSLAKLFKGLGNFLKENIADLLLSIGIASISIGSFLWSMITGFLVLGVLLICLAIFINRGGGD